MTSNRLQRRARSVSNRRMSAERLGVFGWGQISRRSSTAREKSNRSAGQAGRLGVHRPQHTVEVGVLGPQLLDLLGGRPEQTVEAGRVEVEVPLEEGADLLELRAEADLGEREQVVPQQVRKRPRRCGRLKRLRVPQSVESMGAGTKGDVRQPLRDGVPDLVHGPGRQLRGVGRERPHRRAQPFGDLTGENEEEDLGQPLPVVVQVGVVEDFRDPSHEQPAVLHQRGLAHLVVKCLAAPVRRLGLEESGELTPERLPGGGDAQREPEEDRRLLGLRVEPIWAWDGGRRVPEELAPPAGPFSRGQKRDAGVSLLQRLLDGVWSLRLHP